MNLSFRRKIKSKYNCLFINLITKVIMEISKYKGGKNMAYFVAILETIDKKKDAEILEVHKAYLQKNIELGKIFAKGPFTDHTGGLIIYKADTYEEALEVAKNDPVILNKTRKMIFKEWKSTLE